tara:strand:- start:2168 stop:2893 length:726 start_codon:yes stop_codon:yes gene_type:complete
MADKDKPEGDDLPYAGRSEWEKYKKLRSEAARDAMTWDQQVKASVLGGMEEGYAQDAEKRGEKPYRLFEPAETSPAYKDVLPGKFEEPKEFRDASAEDISDYSSPLWQRIPGEPGTSPLLPEVVVNEDIAARLASLQRQGASGEASRQPAITKIKPGTQRIVVNSVEAIIDLETLTPDQLEAYKATGKIKITNGLPPLAQHGWRAGQGLPNPEYGEIIIQEAPPEERKVPFGSVEKKPLFS